VNIKVGDETVEASDNNGDKVVAINEECASGVSLGSENAKAFKCKKSLYGQFVIMQKLNTDTYWCVDEIDVLVLV